MMATATVARWRDCASDGASIQALRCDATAAAEGAAIGQRIVGRAGCSPVSVRGDVHAIAAHVRRSAGFGNQAGVASELAVLRHCTVPRWRPVDPVTVAVATARSAEMVEPLSRWGTSEVEQLGVRGR